MKRIRNYSISGSKYFILGVIFLVTVIITFISMKFEQIMPSATTMADATLPTVAMDTEAGTQYNAWLHFGAGFNIVLWQYYTCCKGQKADSYN